MERIYKYYFIYKTTCKVNNCYYIGKHHADSLTGNYLGSGKNIKNQIEEHGKHQFVREILEFSENGKSLKALEKRIITEDILKDPLCLNIAKGGGGQGPLSDETKKKISLANKGKKRSDEVKAKMSIISTGRICSDETKAKMSIANSGKEHNWHNTRTIETKEKISKSTMGIKKSDETKKKMSEKIFSDKHRENLSIANSGRQMSEETRQKISDTLKRRKIERLEREKEVQVK